MMSATTNAPERANAKVVRRTFIKGAAPSRRTGGRRSSSHRVCGLGNTPGTGRIGSRRRAASQRCRARPSDRARDSRSNPIDRWRPRSIVQQMWGGPFKGAAPCRSNPYGSKTTRSVRRASRPDGARESALYRAVDEAHGGVGRRCLDRLVRHAETRTRSNASRRMDGHAGRRRLDRGFFRNRWLRSSGRLDIPARLISPGPPGGDPQALRG
jgi:hypothetical protein